MTHQDDTPLHDPPAFRGRPAYRVPIGMPVRDDGRRAGLVVSLALHALILVLLIVPFFLPAAVIAPIEQGAGGAGPAGGGGGGSRGSGGSTVETLRYVRLAPDPVPTPTSLPAIPSPVPTPKAEPVKPAPVEPPPVKSPEQQSVVPAPQTTVASSAGVAGGRGTDGTAGVGPGSGGGTGSGVGAGKGSANGAGTGGGTQTNYPPTVLNLTLPPIPYPKSVRGWTMRANFDVDSTGRVLDLQVNESPDRSFDRQLATVLRTYRWRPGTRPDGSPLRMTAQLSIDF